MADLKDNLKNVHYGKGPLETAFANRCKSWLCSKHANWILAAISFAESVFAPIIIDPFLVAMIFASPKKWKVYTFVAITASIIGGVFAYVLGALFFETVGVKFISFYGLEEQFASIASGLNNNGFVFVLLGAFTPIPYKIVALASGLLHIDLVTFITASLFGRILRLGLVGYAAYLVGPKALPVIQRNLHILAALVGVILALYILLRVF